VAYFTAAELENRKLSGSKMHFVGEKVLNELIPEGREFNVGGLAFFPAA
jgi:hypothetical protein